MVRTSLHERTGASGGACFDSVTWDVDTVLRIYLEPGAAPWGAHHFSATLLSFNGGHLTVLLYGGWLFRALTVVCALILEVQQICTHTRMCAYINTRIHVHTHTYKRVWLMSYSCSCCSSCVMALVHLPLVLCLPPTPPPSACFLIE